MGRFFKDQSGSTAIEYSTIAAMMGLALVIVMPNLAAIVGSKFSSLAGGIQSSTSLT
jgi:Flp pilus assembly pilin Flp